MRGRSHFEGRSRYWFARAQASRSPTVRLLVETDIKALLNARQDIVASASFMQSMLERR